MFNRLVAANIKSQANYVEYGYGQVEPNRLSAQYNGKFWGQLPAQKDIKVLEQGQFVKYDMAKGEVNFTGPGEWLLVYNEIKLYHDNDDIQPDCEFALVRDDYKARVYSPFGGGVDSKGNIVPDEVNVGQSRYFNGEDSEYYKPTPTGDSAHLSEDNMFAKPPEKVTAPVDFREPYYNEDPFHFIGTYREKMMEHDHTSDMFPRVFKTDDYDRYTTNTIRSNDPEFADVVVGAMLAVGPNGILTVVSGKDGVESTYLERHPLANASGAIEAVPNDDPKANVYATAAAGPMRWQIVKVYTMPDHQKGVKVMRVI